MPPGVASIDKTEKIIIENGDKKKQDILQDNKKKNISNKQNKENEKDVKLKSEKKITEAKDIEKLPPGVASIDKTDKIIKLKKENRNKINEESKIAEQIEQTHKKSEYIEALIKNGISNVSKKLKLVKKPTKKEIITKKKKSWKIKWNVNLRP